MNTPTYDYDKYMDQPRFETVRKISKEQFEEFVCPLLQEIGTLKETVHRNSVQAADRQSSLERQLRSSESALQKYRKRYEFLMGHTPKEQMVGYYVDGRSKEEMLDEIIERMEAEE